MFRRLKIISLSGVIAIAFSVAQLVRSSFAAGDERSGETKSTTSPVIAIAPPSVTADRPVDFDGLHNVVTYSTDLYSGSAPDDEKAFDTLKALGITTIISVDGAMPNIEAAKAHGLRYIHLPIGYNGMDHERTMQIAKAIQIANGPVYVHCHHGKHRSAGATGAAAVTLGLISNDVAKERMKVSGTAPNYKGLYKCVAVASPASDSELAVVPANFSEVWKPSGLVKSMVEIEEALDALKLIEKSDWKTPPDHPDLIPVAEAGRLADLLRNLQDEEKVKTKPGEFKEWFLKASKQTEKLEDSLASGEKSLSDLTALLAPVAQSCKDCHTKYRD